MKHFEFDEHSNFRITAPGGKKSRWNGYSEVASIMEDGVLYIGVTQYFDGVLPTEKLLKVLETDLIEVE